MSDVAFGRDLPTPTSALAIGAHPDDTDFWCSATLAKWAEAGCVVHHLVCTDGSKGTWDPDADLAELVAVRQVEQRAAAKALGATGEVVWCPGRGLNGAVSDGVAALRDRDVGRAIVAHADLPLARELAWVAEFPGVTLLPDRRRDGSNVLGVPTHSGFRFAYGAGSFARHRAETARLGLPLRIVDDPALRWDVDLPSDLDWPGADHAAHPVRS